MSWSAELQYVIRIKLSAMQKKSSQSTWGVYSYRDHIPNSTGFRITSIKIICLRKQCHETSVTNEWIEIFGLAEPESVVRRLALESW